MNSFHPSLTPFLANAGLIQLTRSLTTTVVNFVLYWYSKNNEQPLCIFQWTSNLPLWNSGIFSYKHTLLLLCLCQILCMIWVTVGLRVVLGVDSLLVGFESDSSSLGLPYNEGCTTHCNLWWLDSDRSARGADGLCRRPRWPVLRYHMGRSVHSHALQM
jgi:hypothetical protein